MPAILFGIANLRCQCKHMLTYRCCRLNVQIHPCFQKLVNGGPLKNRTWRLLCIRSSTIHRQSCINFPDFGSTVLCMCLILLCGICSFLFQIELLTPKDYIGPLMELGQERRGEFKEMNYITENRAKLTYMLPLAEVWKHYCDQKGVNFPPCCNLSNGIVCMKQLKAKNYEKYWDA